MTTIKSQQLAEIIRDPDTIYFLGAGACYGGDLPLGDEAARYLVKSLFSRIGLESVFSELDSSATASWPRFEVVTDIISRYLPSATSSILATMKGFGPGPTHRILASVSKTPRIWLTTNFDDQIELAIAQWGGIARVVTDRATIATLAAPPRDEHLVIKLHGDASVADRDADLGLTIDQILREFPPRCGDSLVAMVQGKPLVFIGYAVRDPDLRPLIRQLVAASSRVAWVGYGEAERSVREALAVARHSIYLGEGSPAALENALGLPPWTGSHDTAVWRRTVGRWVECEPSPLLAQAVATLCLERGDELGRLTIPTVHRRITAHQPIERLWILEREGEAAARAQRGNPNQVSTAVHGLTALAQETGTPIQVAAQAEDAAANLAWRVGELDLAHDIARRAFERSRSTGDPLLEVHSALTYGLVLAYHGGERFDESLRVLSHAEELAASLNLPTLRAESAVRRAIVLMRADNPEESVRVLESIQQIIGEIGIPRRRLVLRVNLAEGYRLAGHIADAERENNKAIEEAEILEDLEVVMNASGNLGLCRLASGDVTGADQAFLRSYELAQERGAREAEANALFNRGWLRSLLGSWSSALPFLDSAAAIYSASGFVERAAGTQALKGWCLLRLGDSSAALGIANEIKERLIVPRGGFRQYWRLLKDGLTLNSCISTSEAILAHLMCLREADHETTIQIACLAALLSHSRVSRELAKRLIERAVASAATLEMPLHTQGLLDAAREVGIDSSALQRLAASQHASGHSLEVLRHQLASVKERSGPQSRGSNVDRHPNRKSLS